MTDSARGPRERILQVRNVGYDKPGRWLLPFRRWATLPFEVLIGWLALLSGVLGILGARTSLDPLDKLLPLWAFYAFQGTYALAGMGLLAGLAAARREIEAFGLILIGASVVVRAIAGGYLIGLTTQTIVSVSFNVAALVACAVRFVTLLRNESIVRYRELPEEASKAMGGRG